MIVVIKVTKACNLRCQYCYMNLEDELTTMPIEIAKAIIEKVGSEFTHVNYSWHGGEPVLAGLDFYEKVIEEQKKFYSNRPEKTFKNSLQTNGLLLSNDWFEFLKDNDFNIGFSYDGHGLANQCRRDMQGNPVDKNLMSVFSRLRRTYDYSPGVICVISQANVNSAAEIYDHFKNIGIEGFSLLPYLGEVQELRISSDEFFAFHKTIFDLWIQDDNPFDSITPLSEIISSLLGLKKTICSWDGRCFHDMVAVEPDGSVLICSAFHGKEHQIGNILSDSVVTLFENMNYKRAKQAQQHVLKECSDCEVFDVCKGGCREASYFTFGRVAAKDPQCEGRKRIVKYVLSRFVQSVRANILSKSLRKAQVL